MSNFFEYTSELLLKYISTRGQSEPLNFEQVLMKGLAEDKGLYMPEVWPKFSMNEISGLSNFSYPDLAFELMRPFIGDSLSLEEFSEIINKSYASFSHKDTTPLNQINKNEYLLELFHGPTLAFKDCAMQLLGSLFEHFLKKQGKKINIICATSGDTGAAAVEAFKNKDLINLVVLFPKNKISRVQQKQMTTSDSNNIHCIAVEGTFDDCQAIVKNLLNNKQFKNKYNLSAVNSINWVRVMAQVVYYFYAGLKLGSPKEKVNFSVPTGNFGDIFAGFSAYKMGLPIDVLCIATNSNDALERFLKNGEYIVENVKPTISPSMDIQVASNLERLLYESSGRKPEIIRDIMLDLGVNKKFNIDQFTLNSIKELFIATSVDEKSTKNTIKNVWENNRILIDPHTAVGVNAGRNSISNNNNTVYIATAHPAKFPDAINNSIGIFPELPSSVANIMSREEAYSNVISKTESVQEYFERQIDL